MRTLSWRVHGPFIVTTRKRTVEKGKKGKVQGTNQVLEGKRKYRCRGKGGGTQSRSTPKKGGQKKKILNDDWGGNGRLARERKKTSSGK